MDTPWKVVDPWRTCYTCQHFEAVAPGSSYVRCMQSGAPLVALGTQPCAYWVREPGADDDCPPSVHSSWARWAGSGRADTPQALQRAGNKAEH